MDIHSYKLNFISSTVHLRTIPSKVFIGFILRKTSVLPFFFFWTAALGTLQDVKMERPTSRFAAV